VKGYKNHGMELHKLREEIVLLTKQRDENEQRGIAHMQAADALREDNRKLRTLSSGYRAIADTYRRMLEGRGEA
jgi:hypothetical protein